MPSNRRDNTQNRVSTAALPLKNGQSISAANLPKFQSINSLETALLAAGYTQAKLNAMTKNDMIFALRKSTNVA